MAGMYCSLGAKSVHCTWKILYFILPCLLFYVAKLLNGQNKIFAIKCASIEVKKYRFTFLNGEEIRLNASQILGLLVHKELFVYYVGAYLFNYFFNVYDFLSGVGPSLFGLILIAIIALTVTLVAVFTLIYIFLLPKDTFDHKIYISIPLAAANTLTSFLDYGHWNTRYSIFNNL